MRHAHRPMTGGSRHPVRWPGLRWSVAVVLVLVIAGCGGQHARGTDDPDLDEMTMSLRFDRKDLEILYGKNVEALFDSSIVEKWKRQASGGKAPVVAVFPIRNETSEHIRGALDSLVSKFETDLVNETPVDVVSRERQEELIDETKQQQAAAYDPERLAQYGRQLGAQYFVTGKVYDVAERTEGKRRVQYFLFIQVLSVETGTIEFQKETSLSKALL